MFDTLTLDLTTQSKTFNCLSPQGQWFCSRKWKRDYPLQECDFNLISEFISYNKPKKVFCNSFYGDSTEYSKIIELSLLCKDLDIEFMVFTTGSNLDKDLIQTLLDNDTSFYLFLYGIHDNTDSIVKNINWADINTFLKQTKNKTIIEFVAYEHNVNDIYELLQLCEEYNNSIKITKGHSFGQGVANIFDSNGKWLYDVREIDYDIPYEQEFLFNLTDAIASYSNLKLPHIKLYRSSLGLANLRYFFSISKGENIFEINIPDKSEEYELKLDSNNKEVFISSSGHLFCDKDSYNVFNNCLSRDWSIRTKEYIYNTGAMPVAPSYKNHSNTQLKKDLNYVNTVVLKNLFYYKKNLEETSLKNNIKKFYWD